MQRVKRGWDNENTGNMRFFRLVAGMDFLLVAEYGENCSDAELVIYKKM